MKTERAIIQLERIKTQLQKLRSDLRSIQSTATLLSAQEDFDWAEIEFEPDQLCEVMADCVGDVDSAIQQITDTVEAYDNGEE